MGHQQPPAVLRWPGKHVGVPDQIIKHSLEGPLFLVVFFSSDRVLAWSNAPNACVFFLFCHIERRDLGLTKYTEDFCFFWRILSVLLSLGPNPCVPAGGKLVGPNSNVLLEHRSHCAQGQLLPSFLNLPFSASQF